jgi:acetate kinase
MADEPLVLTVNAGSSSVRLALFALDGEPGALASARHEGRTPDATFVRDVVGAHGPRVAVVAHRIVHGGPRLTAPCEMDEVAVAAIEEAVPLAPLHNPPALAWVALARLLFARARQVAVFDTGFFAGLPPAAASYALPARLRERWGLRRLGFHGLAHRSMWRALQRVAPGARRAITLQLGSGCSAAALLDGSPVDTSMGFTPLEGLVMATRAGDVDPGLLLFLMERDGLTAAALRRALDEESGLLGLAGSARMGDLLARSDEAARLAVDVFCHRVRRYVGAFTAVLGGCDALAIGGGMGEHLPALRARALSGLEALGLQLDPVANDQVAPHGRISRPDSRVAAWVVPTDEERELAEAARPFLAGA